MKYFQHFEKLFGETRTRCFQTEDGLMSIPEAEDNSDYQKMMAEVEAGTSEIEPGDTNVLFE